MEPTVAGWKLVLKLRGSREKNAQIRAARMTKSVIGIRSTPKEHAVLIKVRVFDDAQQETIFFQTKINLLALFKIAKKREDTFRDKGWEFTQDAVPFFGGEFIQAVQREDVKAIERSAIQAAMTAWLADSIYGGITQDDYKKCFLEFNLHPTGLVVFNRKPI
jgi:hypothetical protein